LAAINNVSKGEEVGSVFYSAVLVTHNKIKRKNFSPKEIFSAYFTFRDLEQVKVKLCASAIEIIPHIHRER
jgi:hypothetical protein